MKYFLKYFEIFFSEPVRPEASERDGEAECRVPAVAPGPGALLPLTREGPFNSIF